MIQWIDPATRGWRTDVIQQAVHQQHAEVVMNVPIPLISRSEVFRWPYTPDGKISVRSAYHSIKNLSGVEGEDAGSSSTSLTGEASVLWRAIWKPKVWPKIRSFMWRLVTNSIAVKGNLARRGVSTSPFCHICQVLETTEHAMFECSWTH